MDSFFLPVPVGKKSKLDNYQNEGHNKDLVKNVMPSWAGSFDANSNVDKNSIQISCVKAAFLNAVDVIDPTTLAMDIELATNNEEPSHESPCPEKPFYLTRYNFYAHEEIYENARQVLDETVRGLEPEYMDIDYDENECMWEMKYFKESDLRDLVLCCYWDSDVHDHVIEFKRMSGDGFTPSTFDWFVALRNALVEARFQRDNKRNLLLDENYTPKQPRVATLSPKRQWTDIEPDELLPTLPPLPSLRSLPPLPPLDSKEKDLPPLELLRVTEEQFIAGVRQITSLAREKYFEPRCEATKALCNLCTKDEDMIEDAEVVKEVTDALLALALSDEKPNEIVERAIMAISHFCEHKCYLTVFGNNESLVEKLVFEATDDANFTFNRRMLQRRAAFTLSLFANDDATNGMLCNTVKFVFPEMQDWAQECNKIKDERTRAFALSVLRCFS